MTEEEKNSEAVQESLPLGEAQTALIEAAQDPAPPVQEAAEPADRIADEAIPEMPMTDSEGETAQEAAAAEAAESDANAATDEPAEIIEEPSAAAEEAAKTKIETEPESESVKADASEPAQDGGGKIKSSTIIGISAVLIAVIAVIYFAAKQVSAPTTADNGQTVTVSNQPEIGKVSIIEEATTDDIGVLVNSGKTVWQKTDVFSFFGNSEKNADANDCTQVYAVKRSVDKKYDSNMMNAISGLLQPITTAEKEAGYFSAIPSGTTLKYLKLDDTGVIEANFSGAIKNAAGSCAVEAIRAQIKSTLMQFSAVKSVVICVDGECDDSKILQP